MKKDYTQDPRFKQAYEEFVNAYLAHQTGLMPYPTKQRERLREVVRVITGNKDYPN